MYKDNTVSAVWFEIKQCVQFVNKPIMKLCPNKLMMKSDLSSSCWRTPMGPLALYLSTNRLVGGEKYESRLQRRSAHRAGLRTEET